MSYLQGFEIKRYDMFMDFDGTKYRGVEKIELSADSQVVLDAVGLKIDYVKANGNDIEFKKTENEIIIKTGSFNGVLEIGFEGEAIERLVGIYKAKYDNDYVISTQFESVHARKMFPCVDKPSYKANFKIKVRIPKDFHVISNMPIERIDVEGNNKKIVTFYETPKMSTYLLYLGIGKWEELSKGKIIVATVSGKSINGEFAAWVAEKSIEFYERYFEFPYMLPKMHLIAVPEFAFGAMENWGAITFRESALLAPKDSDLGQLKRVGEVVAHEIAHQWFGDLVTMKWWDDLWLNESFATFMSYKAVDSFMPSWKLWDDFLMGETSGAMVRDSLSTTHPIHVEVNSPDEIEGIFDDISYGKGASILRMIEFFLGESFRKGLNNYLNHFKYVNAKANDLWDALQTTTSYQVRSIMDSWIMQPGYPYVKVSVEGDKIILEQNRFTLSKKLDNLTYMIPIAMNINGVRHDIVMNEKSISINTSKLKSIKVNLDRTGFYRVYYKLDKGLIEDMNSKEKWGLINDYYNFLLSGLSNKNEYLEIINMYLKETAYLPANEISSQLFMLSLINKKLFGDLATSYHRDQFALQNNKDDPNSKYLRGIIARRLSILDKKFAQELSAMFNKEIEPEMREAVYTAYAITTNDFETLSKKYLTEKLDSERLKFLRSMMFMSDPSIVRKALEWGESNVKSQDLIILLLAASNENARDVLWNWFKSKGFNLLNKAFEGTAIFGRNLMGVIPIIGINKEKEVEEFFANSPLASDPGVKSGLELLSVYSKISRI
ncbi:MAG: M1 family metallopeptidase [Caldisphaera sp.]|jgi:tricorn protease interacting factor F2/3|nr:M1 family metallopeptidase [Caldisphaera sp.]PMP60503.1 MAG: aminopeptidase [Caldisphaera sp.]PMP90518.1 MAG: aminopeptidase [Caldisphaera sp.]